MKYMWERVPETSSSSDSRSNFQDVQSHQIRNANPPNVVNESLDIEAVEKVIANSARSLDIRELQKILDDAYDEPTIEQKAMTYAQGPLNHTGTLLSNHQTRHIIQNCAQVICLNCPLGVDIKKVRNRLVLNMGLYYVSPDHAYNAELTKRRSPYPQYVIALGDLRLPDKMKVELLGKYLQTRILEGHTKFLVAEFPNTEHIAAIFEEDVALIHAYIYVDGPTTKVAGYSDFFETNRSVRTKLEAEGRLFMVDLRKPPREVDADIARIEDTLRSVEYMEKIMKAGDVFRPPPPNEDVNRYS